MSHVFQRKESQIVRFVENAFDVCDDIGELQRSFLVFPLGDPRTAYDERMKLGVPSLNRRLAHTTSFRCISKALAIVITSQGVSDFNRRVELLKHSLYI